MAYTTQGSLDRYYNRSYPGYAGLGWDVMGSARAAGGAAKRGALSIGRGILDPIKQVASVEGLAKGGGLVLGRTTAALAEGLAGALATKAGLEDSTARRAVAVLADVVAGVAAYQGVKRIPKVGAQAAELALYGAAFRTLSALGEKAVVDAVADALGADWFDKGNVAGMSGLGDLRIPYGANIGRFMGEVRLPNQTRIGRLGEIIIDASTDISGISAGQPGQSGIGHSLF